MLKKTWFLVVLFTVAVNVPLAYGYNENIIIKAIFVIPEGSDFDAVVGERIEEEMSRFQWNRVYVIGAEHIIEDDSVLAEMAEAGALDPNDVYAGIFCVTIMTLDIKAEGAEAFFDNVLCIVNNRATFLAFLAWGDYSDVIKEPEEFLSLVKPWISKASIIDPVSLEYLGTSVPITTGSPPYIVRVLGLGLFPHDAEDYITNAIESLDQWHCNANGFCVLFVVTDPEYQAEMQEYGLEPSIARIVLFTVEIQGEEFGPGNWFTHLLHYFIRTTAGYALRLYPENSRWDCFQSRGMVAKSGNRKIYSS